MAVLFTLYNLHTVPYRAQPPHQRTTQPLQSREYDDNLPHDNQSAIETVSPTIDVTVASTDTPAEASSEPKPSPGQTVRNGGNASDSHTVVSAKADEYYMDLDNSDGGLTVPTASPDVGDIEIEVIDNPQKGVQ